MCADYNVDLKRLGISQQDWNKLSDNAKALCTNDRIAMHIANLLSQGRDVKEINDYFDNLPPVKGVGVETQETPAGEEVDPAVELEKKVPKVDIKQLESKDAREIAENQWESYFSARYAQNPAEAEEDIVRVLYRKEMKDVEQGIKDLATSKDPEKRQYIKTKYLVEGYATQQEKDAYNAEVKRLHELYHGADDKKYATQIEQLNTEVATLEKSAETSEIVAMKEMFEDANKVEEANIKKLTEEGKFREATEAGLKLADKVAEQKRTIRASMDPAKRAEIESKEAQIKELKSKKDKFSNPEAIQAYNALYATRRGVKENEIVKPGTHLTPEQMDELVRVKALDSLANLDKANMEKMAIRALLDQGFNKGVREADKLKQEINELKRNGQTDQSRQIQSDAIAADNRYAQEIQKLREEAETENSTKLRADALKHEQDTFAQIKTLRKQGKGAEADALAKELDAFRKDNMTKIEAAMDQTKLNEAKELEKKREEARETNRKAAFEALDPKAQKKIKELEAKVKEVVAEGATKAKKNIDKKTDDIAKIMAEAKVEQQRAENKFNNTVVVFDEKDIPAKKEAGKTYNVVDKDVKDFILEHANKIGFEAAPEGATGKNVFVDNKGKKWVFDSDKFKDYALALSNQNELDNDEEVDPANKADYYATLQERKDVKRDKDNIDAKDPVNMKLKDSHFAKKFFKTAGIETEKNRTVAKRLGYVAVSTIKGAAIGGLSGGAMAALSEFLSTTKIVETPFYKLVQYTGSVPWTQNVHYEGDKAYHQQIVIDEDIPYSGTAHYSDDVGYHAEGDVGYHYEGTVGYHAEGDVGYHYEGTTGYHAEGDVPYDYSGTAHGGYSGTTHGTVPVNHTVTDIENGVVVGQRTWTDNQEVNLPYSGEVDIPYSGSGTAHWTHDGEVGYSGDGTAHWTHDGEVGYSGDGTAHWTHDGTVHVEGDVAYSGTVKYHKVVDADGTVHWEVDDTISGEAQYEGEVEVRGVGTGRPKFDWGNVLKGVEHGAIAGGIAGLYTGLTTMGKIKDEGGGEKTTARELVSRKEYKAPPKPQPIQQVQQTPVVTTPEEKYDADFTGEDEKTIEPIAFTLGRVPVKGKPGVYKAHLWKSLYAACGVAPEDQKAFRMAFRKEILKGAAFFPNNAQSMPPTFKLEGTGKEYEFNLKAFNDTPKEEYTIKQGVKSHQVVGEKRTVAGTWKGQATVTVNGQTKTYKSAEGKANRAAAENEVKDKIDADTSLTPAQKAKAKASIQAKSNPNG